MPWNDGSEANAIVRDNSNKEIHAWQQRALDAIHAHYSRPGTHLLTATLLRKVKDRLTPVGEDYDSDRHTDYLCCAVSRAVDWCGGDPDHCPERQDLQPVLDAANISLSGGGFHHLRVHGFDYSPLLWSNYDQVARHWMIDRMIEIAERTGNV